MFHFPFLDKVPSMNVLDCNWWRQAVIYQIYPRSFMDGNGDGIGDLKGVIDKIGYIKDLGVDAVWLSPFYPSPLVDGGYDVANYCDVDNRLGSLEVFDEMVAALHNAGLKVIVDIVPNHTSSEHTWFKEALASPKGSCARGRYIFRDGIVDDDGHIQPPSTWPGMFGGNVWKQVSDGQYYMHTFAPEQPDLNWDNLEVQKEFCNILRFWSDRGVDGFRVDVADNLSKDLNVIMGDDLPTVEELEKLPADGTHPLYDRDEVHKIYRAWRKVFNEYDPPKVAVAEAWVEDPSRRYLYASQQELGQSFNFDLLSAEYSAPRFKKIIAKNLFEAAKQGASSTWVLSNHDVIRHPTRYGLPQKMGSESHIGQTWLLDGGKREDVDLLRGSRRGRAATLLILGLPGASYIYQGEELGLHEHGELDAQDRQDPTFHRNEGVDVGRDGCRVPLPWTTEKNDSFGFSSVSPHMPQPSWFQDFAVEVEEKDPNSTLNLYRKALRLRQRLLSSETLEWEETGRQNVLQFVRPNGWRVIMNFGDQPVALPAGTVVLSSDELVDGLLPGDTTAWLL